MSLSELILELAMRLSFASNAHATEGKVMRIASILQARLNRFPWKQVGKVFRIAIPVAVFALLLSQINMAQLGKILQNAERRWIIEGFLLFALADVWRALRYRCLLRKKASLLFPITIVQGSLNTVLPFRLGEISFPYLLSKRGVPLEQSVTSLIIVRLLDLVMLCGGTLAVWVFGFGGLADPLKGAMILFGGLIGVGGIGYLAYRLRVGNRFWGILRSSHLSYIPSNWRSTAGRWFDALRKMASPLRLFISAALSVPIWWQNCLASMLFLRSVGVSLTLAQAIFAASILQLASLLPVNFMGGLGILDVSWVGFLVFYGITLQTASESVVATRLIFYVYVLTWSALGWLWWCIVQPRKKYAEQNEGGLPQSIIDARLP